MAQDFKPTSLAFITLGLRGHLTPLVPLLRALADRNLVITVYLRTSGVSLLSALDDRIKIVPIDDRDFPANHSGCKMPAICEALGEFSVIHKHFQHAQHEIVCFDAMSIAGGWLAESANRVMVKYFTGQIPNTEWISDKSISQVIEEKKTLLNTEMLQAETYLHELGYDIAIKGGTPFSSAVARNIIFIPRWMQIFKDRYKEKKWFFFRSDISASFFNPDKQSNSSNDYLLICSGTFFEFEIKELEYFKSIADFLEKPMIQLVNKVDRSYQPSWTVLEGAELSDYLPNCIVLITHGGMNSIFEALNARKPIVVRPKTIEQWANAHQLACLDLAINMGPPNSILPDRHDVIELIENLSNSLPTAIEALEREKSLQIEDLIEFILET